jgi:hypothetical protein
VWLILEWLAPLAGLGDRAQRWNAGIPSRLYHKFHRIFDSVEVIERQLREGLTLLEARDCR